MRAVFVLLLLLVPVKRGLGLGWALLSRPSLPQQAAPSTPGSPVVHHCLVALL